MVSIIITTYKEKKSLPKAIQAFLDQDLKEDYEILVVGPDKDTERIIKEFSEKYPIIKYLKDEGRGKPAALNLAFKQAQGEILVLTDGDVWTEKESLKYLLTPFKDSRVGAISGQPVSTNSRNNSFGFWSHFLTNAAHQLRLKKKVFPCSGYLYAVRRGLVKQIPEDVFSEDAVITQIIRDKGYQVAYAPRAKVYVKYPDNFQDWLKQKVRSTGGYTQKQSGGERNLLQEIFGGLKLFFSYPKNLKEFYWTILLYLSRIYLWLVIFWQIKVKKKKFAHIWQRIESTK